jgi:multidrug resistance protein, MATE family
MGLGWGVAGAALGTVMAEAGGVVLGLAALARLGSRPTGVPLAEAFDRAAMLRVIAVNRDIMIRNVALLAAFALFTSMGARTGDVPLAANAILYNMFLVAAYFLDGFATAAETLCGQAVGARNEAAFRRATALSLAWSLGFGLTVWIVFLLAGEAFIDFVSTNAEVRAYARAYLALAAVSPLLGAAAFAFDGIYTGATWTRAMRDLMLASLAIYVLLLVALQGLGNTGLWFALLALLGARGLGQAALYPRLARRTFAQPR